MGGCICVSHTKKKASIKSVAVDIKLSNPPVTEPSKSIKIDYGYMFHVKHRGPSCLVEYDIDRHRAQNLELSFRSYPESGVCLVDENTLMLAGGVDSLANVEVKNVILIDVSRREIREGMPLPHARKRLRLVKFGLTIYAVGGVREVQRREGNSKLFFSDYSANFAVWDSNKWTELSDMPEGVEHPSVSIYKSAVYVMGGCRIEDKSSVVTDSIQVYDGSWSLAPVRLPEPLYCFQSFAITPDSLLVFGGMNRDEQEVLRSYLYSQSQFIEQQPLPGSFAPVFCSYTRTAGDELFAISEEGVLFSYSLASSSWTAIVI